MIQDKQKDESYVTFAKRVTDAYEKRLIDIDEWGEMILGENIYSSETTRRCNMFMRRFLELCEVDEALRKQDKTPEELDLMALKENIQEERLKLQTVNLEYNQIQRAKARDKLFTEQIVDAIKRLPALEPIKNGELKNTKSNNIGVLCIADAHYGVDINMKDVFGHTVNLYNPSVFRQRMENLLSELTSDAEEFCQYDALQVFDLGDALQGALRMTDLVRLKMGVVDAALEYANYISSWLTELQKRIKVPIKYHCLGGNHCEIRLLNAKAGDFADENFGKIIREFISLRLKDNPNIIVEAYGEFAYENIKGTKILAYHGDRSKKDVPEINYWQTYHNVDIDILIAGHLHHGEQNSIGYGGKSGEQQVIHVPSIVGIDDFSKKQRKIAKAGALFFMIENDGKKTWQKTYILN